MAVESDSCSLLTRSAFNNLSKRALNPLSGAQGNKVQAKAFKYKWDQRLIKDGVFEI